MADTKLTAMNKVRIALAAVLMVAYLAGAAWWGASQADDAEQPAPATVQRP